MKTNKVKFILTWLSHNHELIESAIVVNPQHVGKHNHVIFRQFQVFNSRFLEKIG